MKKKSLILLLFISVFLSSCNDDSYFKIGTGWVDTNLYMAYIDSCNVSLSTVKMDSIPTYGRSTILVGKHKDVNYLTDNLLTGTTAAMSYVELMRPTMPELDPDKVVFDSMVIEMRFNGSYSGDTIGNVHMYVYQMAERMNVDVATGNEVYYNHHSFKLENTPLAEATFPINPSNTKSGLYDKFGYIMEPISIKLPDAFGKDIFEKFRDLDDQVKDNDNFVDYFKGLAFVPGNMDAIVGFRADTFKVNLYYHLQEDYDTDLVITFEASTKNQFNNIQTDRTGTALENIMNLDNEIDAALTNNQSYMQGGDELYVKVEFPYLNNIKLLSDYGAVERATLEIQPVVGTYGIEEPLPQGLSIYASNVSGEAVSKLQNSNNEEQIVSARYNSVTDEYVYSFDVSAFVANQMVSLEANKLYILLKLSDLDRLTTSKRLAVGDSNHSIDIKGRTFYNRAKLRLYYNMYND